MRVDQHTGNVVTAPLAEWQQLTATGSEKQQGDAKEEVLLVMFDPCHLPLTPGWPLRNALLLAAARWRVRQLRVLCVRDNSAGRAAVERSYVLQVRVLRW
jgi:ubiquitin-like modifier-activating enzyme ATG7